MIGAQQLMAAAALKTHWLQMIFKTILKKY